VCGLGLGVTSPVPTLSTRVVYRCPSAGSLGRHDLSQRIAFMMLVCMCYVSCAYSPG